MAFENMAFDPADGLANTETYPTTPASEDAARGQIQQPLSQLRDFINNTLLPALENISEGTSGAENIGSAAISDVTGTTVRAQIADLKDQIDDISAGSVSDGTITTGKLANGAVTDTKMAGPDHVVGARFTTSAYAIIEPSADTAINWDVYAYNPDDSHDAAHAARMVCMYDGVYTVMASVAVVFGIVGDENRIKIRKNGDTSIGFDAEVVTKDLSFQCLNISIDCVALTAGDYLEMIVYHDSETSKNFANPILSMRRNRF